MMTNSVMSNKIRPINARPSPSLLSPQKKERLSAPLIDRGGDQRHSAGAKRTGSVGPPTTATVARVATPVA